MTLIAHGFVAVLAVLTASLSASAAGPDAKSPAAQDVALAEGGVLLGQLVTPQGLPVADVPVALVANGQAVGQSQTDENGRFAFFAVHAGTYQVVAADRTALYRLWAPGTAPPVAQRGVMLVAGDSVVRGFPLGGRLAVWGRDPKVWIAAAAIGGIGAGAYFLAEDDDHRRPASP